MKTQSILKSAAFAGVFLLGIGVTHRAHAATFAVTNANDAGAGSLRQAVLNANNTPSDDTIVFNAATFGVARTITLTSGEMVVQGGGKLTISGPTAAKLTLDGNNAGHIFNVKIGSNVALSSLMFTKGNAFSGGALRIESSAASIDRCTFVGNNGVGSGGAIYSIDTEIAISRSTFSGNTSYGEAVPGGLAGGNGGAIDHERYGGSTVEGLLTVSDCTFVGNESQYGGAISGNNAQVVINNSTLVRNKAAGFGGALHSRTGPLAVNSCTLVSNEAERGGAISFFSEDAGLSLNSSIVVKNTSQSFSDPFDGPVASGDYNLLDYLRSDFPGTHNRASADAKLGELGSNGGPTQTMALLPGSPAIDAGNSTFANDQRGVARPQRSADDIGAVEYINAAPQLYSLRLERTGDALRAVPESGDADRDPITYTYVWRKNGAILEGESGSTLNVSDSRQFKDGDAITATVTASDGFDTSSPLTSRPLYLNDNPPSVVSLTPRNVADKVGAKRTFTLTVSDPDGVGEIKEAWVLINTRLNWAEGATFIYVPNAGTPTNGLLYLRAGDAFLPAMRIGEGATAGAVLDNGAVRLVGSDVTVSVGSDGKTLSLSLPLTIRDGLVGQNRLFGRVVDRLGALDVVGVEQGDNGYRRFGNYTVTPQFSGESNSAPTLSKLSPGSIATALPSSGLAPAQTFVFYAKDENGLGDIESLWFMVGKVPNWSRSATFVYQPRTRRLFLRSDDGNSFLGGGVIGTSGVIENSKVKVDLSKVQVIIYPDGKSMGLRLPIQAKRGLLGQNTVWLRAQDLGRATAPNGDAQGFVASGSWNVVQGTSGNGVAAPSGGGS